MSGEGTGTTSEPTRYAWMRDGLLVAGTLHDWAKMWEGDYYAGDIDLSQSLLTWDGEGAPAVRVVRVTRGAPDGDDWIPYRIEVPGVDERVSVRVDGRA